MENDWQRRVALILDPDAVTEKPKPKKPRGKKAKIKAKPKAKKAETERVFVADTKDPDVKYGLKNLTNSRVIIRGAGELFPGMTMELPNSLLQSNVVYRLILQQVVQLVVLDVAAEEVSKQEKSIPWDDDPDAYEYELDDNDDADEWDPTPVKKRAKRRGQLFDDEF